MRDGIGNTAAARLQHPGSATAYVAIVDDAGLAPTDRLAAALDRAGVWDSLAPAGSGAARVAIRPELGGFSTRSPLATDPLLVETLIDLLHAHGFDDVVVVGSADSTALWAENRDVYALTELLGYRFITPAGRPYDVVDLADDLIEDRFPPGSVLHGTGISTVWADADIRIVFTKNRTDAESGYALGLDTLIGVLPLTDKNLHYRRRRHPGDVVDAVLTIAPVHLALIDAISSAHGGGGRQAPVQLDTTTLIVSSDIVLADYIGALKMGLDPALSPTFARVVQRRTLPERYTISGSLTPYRGWNNVPAPLLRSTQVRAGAVGLDRLVEPWLQRLDPELFPLKHPLDARMNALLAEFFAGAVSDPARQWLLTAANVLLGQVGEAAAAYRTLFDKDALHQMAAPLGIDPASVPPEDFDRLVDEVLQLEPIAAAAPAVSADLRWRMVEDAVVFRYCRTLPIDHDLFVARVDVARTIQFMNDYLGGVIVPVAHDDGGRPIRQMERNVYLPQPNYLVLYRGKPIDVTKLETVEYAPDRHRLYWKTIRSENGSATYDDGIATFQRVADGTHVTIVGRQKFTLPLFRQVFDLDLLPDLKAMLVTHAYTNFFDRTVANFEALIEGREIRIGRPVDEPTPPAVEPVAELLGRIGEIAAPLLQRLVGKSTASDDPARETDADGFVHVRPQPTRADEPAASDSPPEIDRWISELGLIVAGLRDAVRRDMAQARRPE